MTLDVDRLAGWMDDQDLPGGPITDLTPLSGGSQNLVVQFRRGGRSYVLRRPPTQGAPDRNRIIAREARVLAALAGSRVPHPRLDGVCLDPDVLGSAFYLMEAVDGSNPTVALPAPYRQYRRWRYRFGLEVVEVAARIGAVDVAGVGLEGFGRPDGFLERQVARWRGQLEGYGAFAGYDAPLMPAADRITPWLEENRPISSRPGLMHGDFHLANVLCRRDAPVVAAVIDWELSTIGDPLLDLGQLLATWPGPQGPSAGTIGARPWDGFPAREELIDRYAAQTTRDLDAVPWYTALACFRLGVILEGSFARSFAGRAPRPVGERLHGMALGLFDRAESIVCSC